MKYIIYSIPLLSFISYFLLVGVRLGSKARVGDFLALLYFFFLLMGYIYAITTRHQYSYDPNLSAMLFLSLCMVTYIAPVAYIQRRSNLKLDVINYKCFLVFSVFLCVGGFSSMIFFSSKAYHAFQYGFGAFRLELNHGNVIPVSASWITRVFVSFSLFFGVAQLFGLLIISSKIFGAKSKLIGYGLIISSLSYVLNALAFAGRDGVVFWFFSMLFNLVLVRSFFSYDRSNHFFKKLFLFFIFLSVPFFLITYERFGVDMFYSIFYYVAHQLATFNGFYTADLPLYYGDNSFKEIKSYIGIEAQLQRGDYHHLYLQKDVIPWTWGYFVGTLIQDFGRLGTFIFIFLMAALMFLLSAKKTPDSALPHIMPIDLLLVLYLYCQVGFMGVFYFKHYAMNNYILALIALSFFMFLIRAVGKSRLAPVS